VGLAGAGLAAAGGATGADFCVSSAANATDPKPKAAIESTAATASLFRNIGFLPQGDYGLTTG
jgi:hypothetical protein